MTQLPKKSQYHDNDRIAKINLQDFFGNWDFIRPADVDSGREYGQDWLIGVNDKDGTATGMQFGVQSKVLRSKSSIKSDCIQTKINISTLNYLYKLPYPALLHFYDKKKEVGYVMWLDEWYAQNKKPEWGTQKTVLVKIPLSNVLNEQMVQQIYDYVRERHTKQKLIEKIDLINRTSNDQYLEFNSLHAKHSDAIPHVTSLDTLSAEQLRRAYETGELTEITGRFSMTNIHPLIAEDLEGLQVTFKATLDDLPKLPIRLQYLDENNQILYEVKYLELVPTQNGSIIKKWEGVESLKLLSFTFEINTKNHRAKLDFSLYDSSKEPAQTLKYLDVLEKIMMSSKIKFIDLRTDLILYETIAGNITGYTIEQLILEKRLAQSLKTIHEITGIYIEMPDTYKDLNLIERVANIVITGIDRLIIRSNEHEENNILEISGEKEIINDIEYKFNTATEPFYITPPSTNYNVTIYGHKIDLGLREYAFEVVELLERQSISDKQDKLIFNVNEENSYVRFPKWYKPPEETEEN